MEYNKVLYHHGILGQRWGVRRYQNEDGTLTEAGKQRYRKGVSEYLEKAKSIEKKNGGWHTEEARSAKERLSEKTADKIRKADGIKEQVYAINKTRDELDSKWDDRFGKGSDFYKKAANYYMPEMHNAVIRGLITPEDGVKVSFEDVFDETTTPELMPYLMSVPGFEKEFKKYKKETKALREQRLKQISELSENLTPSDLNPDSHEYENAKGLVDDVIGEWSKFEKMEEYGLDDGVLDYMNALYFYDEAEE